MASFSLTNDEPSQSHLMMLRYPFSAIGDYSCASERLHQFDSSESHEIRFRYLPICVRLFRVFLYLFNKLNVLDILRCVETWSACVATAQHKKNNRWMIYYMLNICCTLCRLFCGFLKWSNILHLETRRERNKKRSLKLVEISNSSTWQKLSIKLHVYGLSQPLQLII